MVVSRDGFLITISPRDVTVSTEYDNIVEPLGQIQYSIKHNVRPERNTTLSFWNKIDHADNNDDDHWVPVAIQATVQHLLQTRQIREGDRIQGGDETTQPFIGRMTRVMEVNRFQPGHTPEANRWVIEPAVYGDTQHARLYQGQHQVLGECAYTMTSVPSNATTDRKFDPALHITELKVQKNVDRLDFLARVVQELYSKSAILSSGSVVLAPGLEGLTVGRLLNHQPNERHVVGLSERLHRDLPPVMTREERILHELRNPDRSTRMY